MSTLTSLFGGAGGGTPINGIAQFANAPTLYTDLDNKVWLKAGNISVDLATYPDAINKGNAWELESINFIKSKVVADTVTRGIFFKPDGLKMYTLGITNDNVSEYDLSTAWDISTAVFLQGISVSAQDSTPSDLFFRADGLKMYIIGTAGWDINEYDLSTAWDVTTAVYVRAFGLSSTDETDAQACFFKPDGLKMYTLGQATDKLVEYNLSTAWNISTAVFLRNIVTTANDNSPTGIFFRADGLVLYISGSKLSRYNLSTAWDVSTAVFNSTVAISVSSLFFNPNGLSVYTVSQNSVTEYSLVYVGIADTTGLDSNSYVRIK
jgi:hypothetical protein